MPTCSIYTKTEEKLGKTPRNLMKDRAAAGIAHIHNEAKKENINE